MNWIWKHSLILFFICLFQPAGWAVENDCSKALMDDFARYNQEQAEIQHRRRILTERLGINANPFNFAYKNQQFENIWKRLMEKFPTLKQVINDSAVALREGRPLDSELERTLLIEVDQLLALSSSELSSDLYKDAGAGAIAALVRLELVRIQNAPPLPPMTEIDPTAKGVDPQDKQKDSNDSKDKEGGGETPEYPDKMQIYESKNADTAGSPDSEGGSQNKVSITDVNIPGVSYFEMNRYHHVDIRTGRWVTLPMPRNAIRDRSLTNSKNLRVRPFNKKHKELPLFIPDGYIPETYKNNDTAVWRDETGNYFFKTSKDEIIVKIFPQSESLSPLTPSELEIYTSSTGSKLNLWPEHLQEAISNLKDLRANGKFAGDLGDVELAKELANFLRKRFKYKVDGDSEHDVQALVCSGAFQCDGAASTMTSILRDEFKIPTCPVGGVRGENHNKLPGFSHVLAPFEGHAWVVVADKKGNWHKVDATPLEKDRKSDDEGSGKPSPFKTNYDEELEAQSQEAGSPSGDVADSGDSDSDIVGDASSTLQEKIEKIKEQKNKDQEQRLVETEDPVKNESEVATTDAANMPSLPLDDKLSKMEELNPFVNRFLTKALARTLDPEISGEEKINRLNHLKSILSKDREQLFRSFSIVQSMLTDATMIFVHKRPKFSEWAMQIGRAAPSRPLKDTALELSLLKQQLEFTIKLMDKDERSAMTGLWKNVTKALTTLGTIKHPNSKEIQIASDLYDNLPGDISRKVLRDRFNMQGSINNDMSTLALSKDIIDGKLNEFRVMAILGPHSEFVTDPIDKPSTSYLKIWQRSFTERTGAKSMLTTNDPRDKKKAFKLNPNLSDEEAFKTGQMGILTRKKTIKVPFGREDVDPEKATIILYDTSASMLGTAADFQSDYISAIVDRALSDVNLSGKARHKVYIVGFDSNVGQPLEITTVEKAKESMKKFRSLTANTAGNTDIEKALLYAASMVDRANKSGDKALARANVVLLSDGGSQVDSGKIRSAFKKVSNKTKIMMSFVAIAGTNPALINLAQNGDALGADKSSYIEWTFSDINEVVRQSKDTPSPVNDFWSDKSWESLPISIQTSITSLVQSGASFATSLERDLSAARYLTTNLNQLRMVIDHPPVLPSARSNTALGQLQGLRRILAYFEGAYSKGERQLLLEALLKEWKPITGVSYNQVSQEELGHLVHILKWIDVNSQ